MPSITFPNDTAAGCQIVSFGVSDGTINLITSYNSLGIILRVRSYLILARHINE